MHWIWNDFLLPALLLVLLDSVYLGLSSAYFKRQIMDVQRHPLNLKMSGAVMCYALLVFALYFFVLKPHKNIYHAMILGLVIYGVYETTNYAIFKNWTLSTVLLDTAWGAILFGLTTFLTYQFSLKE